MEKQLQIWAIKPRRSSALRFNLIRKTDPSEIEKPYKIRKQQTRFMESFHEN